MRRRGVSRVFAVGASVFFVLLLLPLASVASASSYCEGASLVLGQSDFNSSSAATSPTGEHGPVAVAFDPRGDLWVAESRNNRVIEYATPFSNGEAASLVVGQPGLASNASGASATGEDLPVGLTFDQAGNLWVADLGNNRILEYLAPFSNGEAATVVIGQPGFNSTMCALTNSGVCSPVDLAFDSHGNLWVADYGYNRVLEFQYPFSTGESASLVLGQPTFTTDAWGASAMSENGPSALAFDPQGALWVVDNNNRVVEYMAPFSVCEPASLVLGQPNFTGSDFSTSASGEYLPEGLAFDQQGNLWVADFGNNRVIGYEVPFGNGEAASIVLGQPGFASRMYGTSAERVYGPSGLAFDSHDNLWVTDYVNNRVLEYKDALPPVLSLSCAPSSLAQGLWTTCQATLKGFHGSVAGEQVSVDQSAGAGSVTPLGACILTAAGNCSLGVMGITLGGATLKASYFGDPDNPVVFATTSMYVYPFVPPFPPTRPC